MEKRLAQHLDLVRKINAEQVTRDAPLTGLRWALSVPAEVMPELLVKYPELRDPDARIRKRGWVKVMNDSDYAHLRVGKGLH